jgi:potassium voltage-gated channel Eag-related subfamily H protein 8
VESDPLKIATEFNSFFTRVGKQISNSIPEVAKAPEDYVNYNRRIPNMQLGNTTPAHVKKVIANFQPKSSCDINGQSTKMIKAISSEISVPLAHIFNLSLSHTCIFPDKLKNCRVIPIFKAGDQMDVDNYRPISLLSSISKVLEKIVAKKLIHHLLSNDLIYHHQYGFLPKKSTEHNLLHIVNYKLVL